MKCIYSIINLKNGKQYIGSTGNFARRKCKHLYMLRSNKHHSISLQNAWNKYGEVEFKFIVIENLCKEDSLLEKEQYYLDRYKSYDKCCGYNICKIAGTPVGIHKNTVFQYNLNGEFVDEYSSCGVAGEKLNLDPSGLSKCARGKYRFYGGYIWSYIKGISEERISLANNPSRRSEESKEKMSNAAKNRTDNLKPIIQYTLEGGFIKEWISTSELCDKKGYSNGYISDCLNGKHEKAYNFIWKFKKIN